MNSDKIVERNTASVLLKNNLFPLPTGAAVILAQFDIDLFRSIAWFNLILGIGFICLLIAMFRGESKWHCENRCQKCKCSLLEWSRLKEIVMGIKVSLIFISLKFLVHSPSGIRSRLFVCGQELMGTMKGL